MKKLNLLFTALLLMCCVGTAKAERVTIDGIRYDVITDTKQATVISGDTKYSGNIVIPSEITYNNVTYSVISIGSSAFEFCSGLTSITIPNSVKSIGNAAFDRCSRLTSITIPNSVTSIGEYVFRGCSGLTSITIPNSVTSIGDYAFSYCSGLTSITIPNSVTSIGDYAFNGCSELESIVVDPGNTKYDNRDNCNAIIETESNTLIRGCNNSVIPNSVTSIGNNAFSQCSGLTSITIPNSVTSIGSGAFYGCSGLTSITIPNSVTSIGDDAFEFCSGLKEVHINDIAAWCSTNFGDTSANPLFYAQNLYLNNELITELVIPNGVTSIGNYAFVYCSGFTSITIPNSVKSIGDYAFAYCSGLTSITIPNSVTSIGNYAFEYCSGLTSVTIGNSVTSIGDSAFSGCYGLKEVHINDIAAWCSTNFGDTGANPLFYAQNLYLNNELITELVIPNGVTSIGNYAFYYCSGLTNITIPNSVTSIGDWAFYNCSGLTEVHINDIAAWCSIDFGSSYANPLYYAHNLYLNNELITELVIPNGVTSIGYDAFYGCTGLTSITIPNSVTSIEYGAFSKCSNLTDVYCLATNVPATSSYAFGSYPEDMTLHVPAEAINSYKTTAPWNSFGNIVAIIVEKPKCDNPVIKYNNGEIEIECETADAEFVTKITSSDFNSFYSNSIALTATYNISVYATAAGYDNSDTVNATLCWIECNCSADDNTDIINIPAKAVLVTSNNGRINISCALEGEVVELYTIDAMYIGSTTIENGTATIESGLSKGNIAIVKIGEKSIKVILN